MNDFAAILHDSPPADPAHPVIVPGEIELRRMARQRQEGIAAGCGDGGAAAPARREGAGLGAVGGSAAGGSTRSGRHQGKEDINMHKILGRLALFALALASVGARADTYPSQAHPA